MAAIRSRRGFADAAGQLFRHRRRGESDICGVEKLGVSQPTVSEHLRIMAQVGLVRAQRIKQWTFYRRDETRIRQIKRDIAVQI